MNSHPLLYTPKWAGSKHRFACVCHNGAMPRAHFTGVFMLLNSRVAVRGVGIQYVTCICSLNRPYISLCLLLCLLFPVRNSSLVNTLHTCTYLRVYLYFRVKISLENFTRVAFLCEKGRICLSVHLLYFCDRVLPAL